MGWLGRPAIMAGKMSRGGRVLVSTAFWGHGSL